MAAAILESGLMLGGDINHLAAHGFNGVHAEHRIVRGQGAARVAVGEDPRIR